MKSSICHNRNDELFIEFLNTRMLPNLIEIIYKYVELIMQV